MFKKNEKYIGNATVKSNNIISGWVACVSGNVPLEEKTHKRTVVEIYIENVYLRSVNAEDVVPGFDAISSDGRVGFSFSLGTQLREYVGKASEIVLRVDGELIPIVNSGKQFRESGKALRQLKELESKLKSGWIVTKKGALILSPKHNDEWRKEVLNLYGLAQKVFGESFGKMLYIAYGTLLGFAREGDIIAGDDDFDSAYLSEASDPDAIKAEFIEIASKLINLGHNVRIGPSGRVLKWQLGNAKIDIFPSWFQGDQYCILYSVKSYLDRTAFRQFMPVQFSGHTVYIPEKYEGVLEAIYGSDWRVPNPAFQWTTEKKNDPVLKSAGLSKYDRVKVYWEKVYFSKKSPFAPSQFAFFAIEFLKDRGFAEVIDLGCGNGRDSIALSKHYQVLAMDYSQSAVDLGNRYAEENGIASLRFCQVDASSLRQLNLAHQSAFPDKRRLALYSRFFLHAIPDEYEGVVLEFAAGLPHGSIILFEFRTERDNEAFKAFGEHFRRYIPLDALLSRIEKTGRMRVLHSEQGYGMAVYGEEDPHVARVVFEVI